MVIVELLLLLLHRGILEEDHLDALIVSVLEVIMEVLVLVFVELNRLLT